ncbi:MAG: arsenical pump membrane protein-domain-containing protein [Linnemannia gamsii]|nr:MAG: arsenical pump membrane protein-domain-containing protein [Linnemannia gamsii]
MDTTETTLTVHSWLSVITFLVVIAIVIRPIRIPLPIPVFKKTTVINDTDADPSALQAPPTLSETTDHTQSQCEDVSNSNYNNNSYVGVDGVPEPSIPHTGTFSSNSLEQLGQGNMADATTHPRNNHLDDSQKRKIHFPYDITLNIATAPVLGVMFLLATKSITGQSVRDGILGEPSSGVEPFAVMVLFFSLAYICISLDMTGVFQYAAFWISRRGGGGGQRIFLAFFLLSSIMSGLASNDVVILTMTPFLVYFSQAVELATPVAFLMAELQTANIASMALYIGNLTNVVVCQAYKISFVEYSAWMLLPCIASIAACYMMLRITFRKEKYIPKLIKTPLVDSRSCLKDPAGAVFGLAVLGCSLACLIGTSFAHVSVWMVTGPFALIAFARDVWYDVRWYQRRLELGDSVTAVEVAALDDVEMNRVDVTGLPEIAVPGQSIALTIQLHSPVLAEQHLKGTGASSQGKGTSATADEVTIPFPTEVGSIRSVALSFHAPRNTLLGRFQRRFPLLYGIGIRMPWAILPFTFSMFIMVEGLSHSGWIAIFATWATRLVPNYVAATYAIGFVSVLLCNLFNNVPMTILVARILQHPNFANSPLTLNRPEVVRGCVLALVVGSNLGACTTLISSLAGLMWDSVLRSKNSNVGFWTFFRWNMGVMPVVIFVALSVVVLELTVIY